MGDVLKDLMEAANNRIRSPFIGSIIFVFLAVNWRPLFNLLFGDTEVLVRIAHFDNVTTWQSLYLWPVVGGVVFALASPWLKHVGALWAQFPNAKLKSLQDEAVHRHKLADLKREQEIVIERTQLENAQADMLIEAAKKEAEAEEIGGEELREEVKQDREQIPPKSTFPLLTDEQNQLMIQTAQDNVLRLPIQTGNKLMTLSGSIGSEVFAETENEAQENRVKRKVADKLVSFGFLRPGSDNTWRVTEQGKEYVKHLANRGHGMKWSSTEW